MQRMSVLFSVLMLLFTLSCSTTNTGGQQSPVVETHYRIPASYPVPPNPSFPDNPTPAQYNYALFTRYSYDPEPKQLRAILILMPGIYGGSSDFDNIAKTVVAASKGGIEVWTIDRRSMQIEDLTGFQEAYRKRDPSIAYGYYFSGATVDGKTYGGPVDPSAISYISEWGLDMTIHDLNDVVSLVPRQYRKTNVFLGAHSLGSWIIEDYAASDFGTASAPQPGYDNVAGLIMIDGGGTGTLPTLTEAQYLSGTAGNAVTLSGLSFPLPGISTLRQTPAQNTIAAFLGEFGPMVSQILVYIQIAGLYAAFAGDALTPLLQADNFQLINTLLMGGNMNAKVTNEAMLGFTMDRHFDPLTILTLTLGLPNGPLAPTTSPLAPGQTMYKPTDPGTMVYTWNGGDHITGIKALEAALSDTYTTLTEWYFPTRLLVDLCAMGDTYGLNTQGWQAGYGFNFTYTSNMDAPVLAFGGGSGLEQTATVFYKYRGLLPPARNCDDQPRTACGFDIHIMPGYTHFDMLLSDPSIPADTIDPTIYTWIMSNTSGSMPSSALSGLPAPHESVSRADDAAGNDREQDE